MIYVENPTIDNWSGKIRSTTSFILVSSLNHRSQFKLHDRLRQAITVSGLDPPIQSRDVCM